MEEKWLLRVRYVDYSLYGFSAAQHAQVYTDW